jgi:hypothetical protein
VPAIRFVMWQLVFGNDFNEVVLGHENPFREKQRQALAPTAKRQMQQCGKTLN